MRSGAARGSMSYFGNEVADTAQRSNDIAAELAPQAMNVHLDGIAADLLVPAIETIFELRSGQYRARPLQQRFQHRILVRRQTHRHAVALNGARRQIQAQLAVLDGGVAASGGTAKNRAH